MHAFICHLRARDNKVSIFERKPPRAQVVQVVKRPRQRATATEVAARTKTRLEAAKVQLEIEKMRRDQAYLDELRNTDPVRYHEIMGRRVGIGHHAEEQDRLAVTFKTLKDLKGTGLMDDPRDAGKGGDLRDVLRDWGPLVGQIVQGLNGGQAARPFVPPPQQITSVPPPPATVAEIVVEATEVPQTPQPPAAQQKATQPEAPTEEGEPSVESTLLIGHLNGKTPSEAALWLLGQAQQTPQFAWLIGEVNRLPDVAMAMFLTTLGEGNNGQLRGFTSWLLDNQSWTLAVVHEVRRLSASAPVVVAES